MEWLLKAGVFVESRVDCYGIPVCGTRVGRVLKVLINFKNRKQCSLPDRRTIIPGMAFVSRVVCESSMYRRIFRRWDAR